MKKIIFFTETKWAFGTIHNALTKLLWQHGFNCELLDFFTKYQPQEILQINNNTDYFVTTPPGAVWLIEYGVDPSKIYAVAHAQWDILLASKRMSLDFQSLRGYSVVSQELITKSQEFGITRTPQFTPIGVFFDRFYQPINHTLNNIGYAASWEGYNFWGQEIKRGNFVKKVADSVNVPLEICNKYHYLAMPGFYQQITSLMMSSLEEGAGLPIMEAAAAGKLTLGTPVGYFAEYANHAELSDLLLPKAEGDFVNVAVDKIKYFIDNPQQYHQSCQALQSFARDKYDWSNVIHYWVDFLCR